MIASGSSALTPSPFATKNVEGYASSAERVFCNTEMRRARDTLLSHARLRNRFHAEERKRIWSTRPGEEYFAGRPCHCQE